MRRILILTALAILLVASSAWATGGKVVVVTIGSASLDDVMAKGLPNLSHLMKVGAVGVMNARPASVKSNFDDSVGGRYSMEGGCLTIGAGTRAAATTDARNAYNATDMVDGRPARQLYESLYGRSEDKAEVIQLGMNRLWYVNSDAKYTIEPGAIGTALHQKHLKTAAVGNSDTPNDERREAALIATDGQGVVDFGNVGSAMIERDVKAPYGIRTNQKVLLAEFDRVIGQADLVVVDTGDVSRAASYVRHCSEEQGMRLRGQAMKNADRIIGQVLSHLDLTRDLIIVVSPNPSNESMDNLDFLPPVVAAGNGIKHGLLTSGSTRQPGIVTNADVSASILSFFDLTLPCSFVGRQFVTINRPTESIVNINKSVIDQISRQPAMRGLASFLVVLVIVLSVWIFQRKWKISAWASYTALVPVALMLTVLWLPAITNSGLFTTVAVMIGLTLGLVLLAWIVTRSPWKAFAWLCAAVAVTVIADVLRGDFLLSRSIMSYTPVDGARYYGIGNEHMGSVISAVIFACGFLASMMTKRRTVKMTLLAIILGIMVIAIGLPSLGANAGGAMSAMAAAVYGFLLWREKTFTKKHVIITVGSVFAALGLMLVVDLMRPGSAQSHIGRAAHAIASGGAEQMFIIIGRKLAMNFKLLQYSAWSKLLIASAASAGLMIWTKSFDVRELLRKNKSIYSAILAALAGAITALIFNDSGVVAAATAFIYIWTAITLAAIDARNDGEQEPKSLNPARASEARPVQPTGHN